MRTGLVPVMPLNLPPYSVMQDKSAALATHCSYVSCRASVGEQALALCRGDAA